MELFEALVAGSSQVTGKVRGFPSNKDTKRFLLVHYFSVSHYQAIKLHAINAFLYKTQAQVTVCLQQSQLTA